MSNNMTATGVRLMQENAQRYYSFNPVHDAHPWRDDLREYARVLENPERLSHYTLAVYGFRLEGAIRNFDDTLQIAMMRAIHKRGGMCHECLDMYHKCLEYAKVKQS